MVEERNASTCNTGSSLLRQFHNLTGQSLLSFNGVQLHTILSYPEIAGKYLLHITR